MGGMVHNDIKPDNILVMEEFDPSNPHKVPWVQISDYGTATFSRDTSFSWGDPRYQSPETWSRMRLVLEKRHRPSDVYKVSDKADIWSLAAVLFELLSGGKIPFLYLHASLTDVMDNPRVWNKLRDAIEKEDIEIGPHCQCASDPVEELLERLFQKDPKKRPDAVQLLKDKWFDLQVGENITAPAVLSGLVINGVKSRIHYILLNALGMKLKSDHSRESQKAFLQVDTDHSGSISLQEFEQALSILGQDASHAKALFEAADINKDGRLIFPEFMAATFDWDKAERSALDQSVRRLFKDIDANGSGQVSVSELSALLGNVDKVTLSEVFTCLDADDDGKVSISEFEHFLFKPCCDALVTGPEGRHRLRSDFASSADLDFVTEATTTCTTCSRCRTPVDERKSTMRQGALGSCMQCFTFTRRWALRRRRSRGGVHWDL